MPMEHPDNPNYLARSVWASLYRRDLLEQNHISFLDRNLYFEEDTLFNIEAFLTSVKVAYVNQPFYHWVKYPESTSETVIPDIEQRQMRFLKQLVVTLQKQNALHTYRKELWILVSRWLRVHFPYYKHLPREELKQFFKTINYPLWGRHYDLKLFSKKRIKMFLFVLRLKYC